MFAEIPRPAPTIEILKTQDEEIERVSTWIGDRAKEGVAPTNSRCLCARLHNYHALRLRLKKPESPFKILDESIDITSNYASISTMHLAKGLEFRAVVVIACDDEVATWARSVSASVAKRIRAPVFLS